MAAVLVSNLTHLRWLYASRVSDKTTGTSERKPRREENTLG